MVHARQTALLLACHLALNISASVAHVAFAPVQMRALHLLRMTVDNAGGSIDLQSSALDLGLVSVRDAGNKGLGLFADRYLPVGMRVGQYAGEILTHREIVKRYPKGDSEYVFQVTGDDLQRRELLYIDARDPEKSNLTRYINCDRNSPNLVVEVIKLNNIICTTEFEQTTTGINSMKKRQAIKHRMQKQYCVVFVALRDIFPGEELTFDYGDKYPIDEYQS